MRPLEALMGASGGQAVRGIGTRRESRGGFEALFADATARVQEQPPPNNERPVRPPREAETHSGGLPPEAETYARSEQPCRFDDEAPPAQEAQQEQSTPYDAAYYTSAEAYAAPLMYVPAEQVIEAVAEILQVPAQEAEVLLEQAAVMPHELAEPQAVTKLLQQVYEAQAPVDLLTEPEFPAVYKAIGEAMAQLATKEAAPTAPVNTVQAAAQPAAQAATSIPVVEGLQYAVQDGEVVVSNYDLPLEEAEQQQTTRPPAPTQQSAATAQAAAEAPDTVLAVPEAITTDTNIAAVPMTDAYTVRTEAAQAVQQAAQTAQAQQTNPADIISQIVSQVRMHSGEQVTEMRLTLRPEALGDIVLRVLTQNGIVTAQFIAETQRVREALEVNFNQLRDALEEQGIQFSELSVSVRQNAEEQERQFAQARANARHRADSVTQADDPVSLDSIDFDNTINLTA